MNASQSAQNSQTVDIVDTTGNHRDLESKPGIFPYQLQLCWFPGSVNDIWGVFEHDFDCFRNVDQPISKFFPVCRKEMLDQKRFRWKEHK
jgi:hypothetical protein